MQEGASNSWSPETESYNGPISVKLQAFKGLILRGFEYASTVCNPYQLYFQDNLEKVQKESARFIN